MNEQRKHFVLSFAGHVHGILVAEVASEPLNEQAPLGPLRSRAGWADWNHDHPCDCISAFLSKAGCGQVQEFSFLCTG